MSKPFMHELLIMMNMVDGEHKTPGAHFKNLPRIETEGEVFEKMGQATSIDLADPAQLAVALGPVNAAMVAEVASLTAQLNAANEAGKALEGEHSALIVTHNEAAEQLQAMTARAADLDRELGHVTRERDDAQAREKALTEAAEAGEEDRATLLDQLAGMRAERDALRGMLQAVNGGSVAST